MAVPRELRLAVEALYTHSVTGAAFAGQSVASIVLDLETKLKVVSFGEGPLRHHSGPLVRRYLETYRQGQLQALCFRR